VLLGDGVRLFEPASDLPALELLDSVDSPVVSHLRYRVKN
jgi:hypothetical protein